MAATSFIMLCICCCVQFIGILLLLNVILNYDNQSFAPNNHFPEELHSQIKQAESTKQKKSTRKEEGQLQRFSSSVFCTGYHHKKDRECRFLNLCYNNSNDKYLFLSDENSRVFGVPVERDIPALLDLSSVDDHSAKYFNYKEVPSLIFDKINTKIQFIKGSSILFHRFNPENIMHVIHDDLIPLYHMKRKYFTVDDNVNFVMMDGREEKEYSHLYEMYSQNIFMKNNFSKEYVCFEDVVIGLSKTTTWYQFGFREPQGPINIDNYPVNELKYFREDFKAKLSSAFDWQKSVKKYIVIFSRSHTRKILNQGQLMFKLTSHFKMPVQTVDLEIDSTAHIVSVISKAHIVIGVHGAHMITSLFMQPNTVLLELFPFAVPAENYTPYKTLAGLIDVKYIAWENKIEKNTVTHEDWPSFVGGISELSAEKKKEIKAFKSVPIHLCCKDPVWLFRIYQDTTIDVKDLIKTIENGVKEL